MAFDMMTIASVQTTDLFCLLFCGRMVRKVEAMAVVLIHCSTVTAETMGVVSVAISTKKFASRA